MTLGNKQKEILAKAVEILNEEGYLDACLNACICPDCGEKLKTTTVHRVFGVTYSCKCGYSYYRRI